MTAAPTDTAESPDGGATERELLEAAQRVLKEELQAAHRHGGPGVRASEPEADRETLVAFFTARDPAKLPLVDSILEKFAGREPSMYEGLVQQYGLSRNGPHRDDIVKYYALHNPSRICAVDVLLDLYRGREEQLLFLLVNKYQPGCPLRLWVRYFDDASQHYYYYDRVSRAVQWERPTTGYVVEPDGSGLTKLGSPDRHGGAGEGTQPAQHWYTADPPATSGCTEVPLPLRAPPPRPQAWSPGPESPPPRAIAPQHQGYPPAQGSPPPHEASLLPQPRARSPPRPPPRDMGSPQRPVLSGAAPCAAQPPQQHGPLSGGAAPCAAQPPQQHGPQSASPPPRAPASGQGSPARTASSSRPGATGADSEVCLCEECHAVCRGFEALAAHKEQAGHGAWFACPAGACPYQFPSQHSLLLHQLQCHPSAR
eukprot:TRINITY_DN9430_c0_g1_i2.p1 TRINITY_DN9430_c0_g1~~TRINITY_DN9430_c0_g1_i2.p1  ORF type:complete len:426 (+),score=50.49 TRINITY_DN9430_c0_g1_i2:107-1384(+)